MRKTLDFEVISAALVTSAPSPEAPWRSVEFHPSLGSTNDRAKELLGAYAAEPGPVASPLWRAVLTDDQTGGRGRLGRAWEVPPRASIAVSATVAAPDADRVGWVPLLAGLALARAITEVTAATGRAVEPRLKWPNDVLLADDEDRKVAGILCEMVSLAPKEAAMAVVVGAGVNVDQKRTELPVDTATSLALAGATVAREDLVIAYLRHLAVLLQAPDGDAAAYRAACSTLGAEVRVFLPGGEIVQGQATSIDRTGALVLATARGVRSFAAGDVVHVRRPGSTVEREAPEEG